MTRWLSALLLLLCCSSAADAQQIFLRRADVGGDPTKAFDVQRITATIGSTSETVQLVEGTDYNLPAIASSTRSWARVVGTHQGYMWGDTSEISELDHATVFIDDGSTGTNVSGGAIDPSTEIYLRRDDDGVQLQVEVEIITYVGSASGANEIVVRHQQAHEFSNSETSVTTSAISGIVTDAAVLPWISGTGCGDNQESENGCANYRTTYNAAGDTVTMQRVETSGSVGACSIVVLEFTGSNWSDVSMVSYGPSGSEWNGSSDSTTNTTTITGNDRATDPGALTDITRALTHTQWYHPSAANADSAGMHARITGTDTITWAHSDIDGGDDLRMWIVEHTGSVGSGEEPIAHWIDGTHWVSGGAEPQTKVHSIGATLRATDESSLIDLNTSTDSNNNGNTTGLMTGKLTSTTQVTLERFNNAGEHRPAMLVWEWPRDAP